MYSGNEELTGLDNKVVNIVDYKPVWLGERELDPEFRVIQISDYLSRRERRVLLNDLKKGHTHSIMNYLPFTYTKELTEFPSNPELIAAGYAGNSATLVTKMTGKQELEIAALSSLEVPDPNDPTKMISAFSGPDVIVKMAKVLLVKWTFKDLSTGEVFAVTEDNITSLLQPDFDYIVKEVSDVLTSMNPDKKVLEVAEPASGLTETQKNESLDSSAVESKTSETPVSETPVTIGQ
jgi:hypothetical protein